MDLDNYKCYICKILFPGDDVYECGNKHLVCENCFSKNGKVCEVCQYPFNIQFVILTKNQLFTVFRNSINKDTKSNNKRINKKIKSNSFL